MVLDMQSAKPSRLTQEALISRLLRVFSRPRPPGSRGERVTARFLQAWIRKAGLPAQIHTFVQVPWFFETLGLWLLLAWTGLLLAVMARGGLWATLLALLAPLLPAPDLLTGRPWFTALRRAQAANFILSFGPKEAPAELVFSAHYDSKTELFDHVGRGRLLRLLPLALTLTLATGLLAPFLQNPTSQALYLAHVAMAVCAWAIMSLLGLHLFLGRWLPQSTGTVDNGAACIVLLLLACRLKAQGLPAPHLRVTLALFAGEEANMQGARAYVASRPWPPTTRVVNLELLGQDGSYVLWRYDGDAFHRVPTPEGLRKLVARAVREVTGSEVLEKPQIHSDAYAFLRAGLPAVTLGTMHRHWGLRGLHRPSDSPERLSIPRLQEHVDVLWHLIRIFAAHDVPEREA